MTIAIIKPTTPSAIAITAVNEVKNYLLKKIALKQKGMA